MFKIVSVRWNNSHTQRLDSTSMSLTGSELSWETPFLLTSSKLLSQSFLIKKGQFYQFHEKAVSFDKTEKLIYDLLLIIYYDKELISPINQICLTRYNLNLN